MCGSQPACLTVFQLPDRFKFAPEMEAYVDKFLTSCDDPERQLAVMIGFSTVTNQGYPVVPSVWRVVRHLQPVALQKYVEWLKDMFLKPDLDCCLDFSTNRQKQNQENKNMWVRLWCIFSFCFVVKGAANAVLKAVLVNCNPLVGQIDCCVVKSKLGKVVSLLTYLLLLTTKLTLPFLM